MSGAVDWGYALYVAGTGFGVVLLVLSAVALALWGVGLITRMLPGQEEGKGKNSTRR